MKNLYDPIKFTDSLRDIKTKIASGVYLTSKSIAGLLPLDPEDYATFSMKKTYGIQNPGKINWYLAEDRQIFGPSPGVMNAFKNFGGVWGHSHEVPLVTRVTDEHVLSHLALQAADTLSYESGNLYVNENAVPMTKDGLIELTLLISFIL